MSRMKAPNGADVSVADDKADRLLRHGFTAAEQEKAPTKKAAPRKRATKKSD